MIIFLTGLFHNYQIEKTTDRGGVFTLNNLGQTLLAAVSWHTKYCATRLFPYLSSSSGMTYYSEVNLLSELWNSLVRLHKQHRLHFQVFNESIQYFTLV